MLLESGNNFFKRVYKNYKIGNQCSSKSLSNNYLTSKFAKWHFCINHKVVELLKPV